VKLSAPTAGADDRTDDCACGADDVARSAQRQLWFESCIDRDVLSSALAESGFIKIRPDDPVPGGASVVEMVEALLPSSRKARVPDYIEVEVPAYMAAHLSGIRATH